MNLNWDKVPATLAYKLLLGSVGKMHLTALARTALPISEYTPMGADMLLAAWEADPLDGISANQLAQILPQNDTSKLGSFFSRLTQHWEVDNYVLRLQQQMKIDQFVEIMEQKRKEGSCNLFHLQKAAEFGPAHISVSWTKEFLQQPIPEELAPAVEYTMSFLDLLEGDVEKARHRCKKVNDFLPFPGIVSRLGECEYRLGNKDKALKLWREALENRPWNTTLALKAYDAVNGLDQQSLPLDGGVNILLYSFNKGTELDQTLTALVQSDLQDAKITVLNNGSSDNTDSVINKWADQLGKDRFESVTLPVNVGAPAARNWLMHREDTASRPWTVYLDDDAVVPTDWLGRLGCAVQAYPEAGVWGCRVVDADMPHVIQNADLSPRPDYTENDAFKPGEMSDLHHQTFDAGDFNYIRPCASVTGCCHMFRTETLLESGDFELAFSPSQFDDLDHDLRLVLNGKMAVYQGHLPIRHMKRSGKQSHKGGMPFISAQGNHEKLKNRYAGKKWDQILMQTYGALLQDMVRKFDALRAVN